MKHKEPEEFAPGLWHIWPENWHVPMTVNSDQYQKLKGVRISTAIFKDGGRVVRCIMKTNQLISPSNILFPKSKNRKGTQKSKHKDGDRFNWLPENMGFKSSYNIAKYEKYAKILAKGSAAISRYHISIRVELLLWYYLDNFRNNNKLERIDTVFTGVYRKKMTAQSQPWYIPRFDYMERAAEEIAGHANRKAQIINLLCGGKYGIS
jgi:hypothetical protein